MSHGVSRLLVDSAGEGLRRLLPAVAFPQSHPFFEFRVPVQGRSAIIAGSAAMTQAALDRAVLALRSSGGACGPFRGPLEGPKRGFFQIYVFAKPESGK